MGVGVSLNHPLIKCKKTVCQKNPSGCSTVGGREVKGNEKKGICLRSVALNTNAILTDMEAKFDVNNFTTNKLGVKVLTDIVLLFSSVKESTFNSRRNVF